MNPLFDQPAVDFQLLFARPAHADAHLEPRQVGPHLLQPRQRVLQLRQLDGQTRLVRLGTAAKMSRISSLRSSTLTLVRPFEIARLGRRQIVVEHAPRRRPTRRPAAQLVHLALAQIGRHVGRFAALVSCPTTRDTGRRGQPFQFLERIAVDFMIGSQNANENGRLAGDALLRGFISVTGGLHLL